jgi:hypothetical protein
MGRSPKGTTATLVIFALSLSGASSSWAVDPYVDQGEGTRDLAANLQQVANLARPTEKDRPEDAAVVDNFRFWAYVRAHPGWTGAGTPAIQERYPKATEDWLKRYQVAYHWLSVAYRSGINDGHKAGYDDATAACVEQAKKMGLVR